MLAEEDNKMMGMVSYDIKDSVYKIVSDYSRRAPPK